MLSNVWQNPNDSDDENKHFNKQPHIAIELQVHYNIHHYVIVQLLLSNTCNLFSRIFEVFNEMEM